MCARDESQCRRQPNNYFDRADLSVSETRSHHVPAPGERKKMEKWRFDLQMMAREGNTPHTERSKEQKRRLNTESHTLACSILGSLLCRCQADAFLLRCDAMLPYAVMNLLTGFTHAKHQ